MTDSIQFKPIQQQPGQLGLIANGTFQEMLEEEEEGND